MLETGPAATRNYLTRLALSRFRNYDSTELRVDARPVVLIGPNGAGKTNILEAVSLLSPGRGFRRAALADIDNTQGGPWAIVAELHGPRGDASIGTGREAGTDDRAEKRIVRIDGKPVRGQAGLAHYFSVLWLTPQMDNLFIEGGTARRRFLDRLVFSFDGDHAARVGNYELAMRERNRLLAGGRQEDAWLSGLERRMAEQGVAIAVARAHAVEGLTQSMGLAVHSFPQARLSLHGTVEEMLTAGSALAAEEKYSVLLADARARDAAAGRSLSGVHRTELRVIHAEKQMAAERCSTGEQKALLVSIILAQARAGAAWHESVPALLLDEVATHLDPVRRGELYAELHAIGAQAWITGTDRAVFGGLEAQMLQIAEGKVTAV